MADHAGGAVHGQLIRWQTTAFSPASIISSTSVVRGRGKDSGVEVDLAICQVVAVRDGQLIRMHDYTSRDEALEAAQDRR